MQTIIRKTFGGLSREYYFRQLFFGCLIAGVMFWFKTATYLPTLPLVVGILVNTMLYPYARFVWESIVGFIVGQNMFFFPAIILLGAKLVTMFVCWQMAILIAPLGLGWLYWHHSRTPREY